MSLTQNTRAVLESMFRQRMEELLACEMVTEMGRRRASLKPKLLVLCGPAGGGGGGSAYSAAGGHTLHLLQLDDGRRVKIRQSYGLERLADCSHEGDFDATFSFGASGVLSVTFESLIQREMFMSAVRRLQGGAGGGGARRAGAGGGVRGVLTQNVEALADADAATRVRKLRQERRLIFSSEEERHLLKHMGQTTFDDVKRFQEVLLFQQKEAELASLDALVTSAAAWRAAREQVRALVQEVEQLEGRIEEYSSHLLSKKDVIQQIEHDNNTLQRKQQNLEGLYVMMADLRDQLSLAPGTLALVARLRAAPDESLSALFAEGQNARTLSEAMRHMQGVLHNPKLEADFPIAAVAERKAFFLETRRMIARRSRAYLFSTMEQHEALYLQDKSRFSTDGALVWRLHLELTAKLLGVADIIVALARIDMEEFASALRKYRTTSQRVYAAEMHRFFKGLRRQVKKASSWRGPFLLGAAVDRAAAMETRMETAQAGETPQLWRRGSGASSAAAAGGLSPAITPRMLHFDDDREYGGYGGMGSIGGGGGVSPRGGGGGGASGSSRGASEQHQLSVTFPSSPYVSGVDLYSDPTVLRRLDARAASHSVVSGLRSIGSGGGGGANGHLRPDLAFAVALQSALTAVLHEEHVLGAAFGVREPPPPEEGFEDLPASPAAAAAFDSGYDNATADAAGEPARPLQDTNAPLLRECLVEIFGGDGMSFATADQQRREDAMDAGRRFSAAAAARETAEAAVNAPDAGVLEALTRDNYLLREMTSLATFFGDKCDRIYSLPMLCMVRAYRRSALRLPTRASSFCQAILAEVETVVAASLMRFVAEQTESINRCKRKYIVKPTALLHCFAQMPAFFLRLETVHRLFSAAACDVTEYNSVASSLVDQSFDVLDTVTGIKAATGGAGSGDGAGGGGGGAEGGVKLSLGEQIQRRLNTSLEGLLNAETSAVKRGFIQQYRHHAFFCAMYNMLPPGSFAAAQLADHFESSKAKKDRYEELYLTRVLFTRDFAVFGPFVVGAEDLSHIYSRDELRHHRALAADAVRKVAERLAKDIKAGVRGSGERMKKHLLRDVVAGGPDESFHRALLQRTWRHYSQLVLQKFDFFTELLRWPAYAGIAADITRGEVSVLLSSM